MEEQGVFTNKKGEAPITIAVFELNDFGNRSVYDSQRKEYRHAGEACSIKECIMSENLMSALDRDRYV